MNSISIFHTGFVICLAGAILFLVITAVLFFVFDIKTIYAIRSGRAQAKTVKEMELTNSSTGRLRTAKKPRASAQPDKKKTSMKKSSSNRPPAVQPPVRQIQRLLRNRAARPLCSTAGANRQRARTALPFTLKLSKK